MPSFLDETTSPLYHDSADILDLDPHNHFGVGGVKSAKANDTSLQQNPPHSSAIHEPFDETSNSSIHDSDISDAAPMTTNGNITRPTSMNSLPNGKSASARGSVGEDVFRDSPPRIPNGAAALPDRSVQRTPQGKSRVNGAETGDQRGSLPTIDGSSNSTISAPHSSPEKTPRRSNDHAKPPLQTIPSEGSNGRSEPFASPSSPADLTPPRSSPHRLSSPPVYNVAAASSSSQHLQPPHPGSTLKQRHTLEVPKLPSSGRTSKDWSDPAYASGRFSPTVGGRRPSLNLARRTTRSMQSDAPRDEIVPDEDAQRWAEAYRQKRASKRRRKEEEDDDRVVVGTKVDETHANWVMAYNMLTGIRVSVSRTNAKLDRELNDADFEVKQKSTFDMYVFNAPARLASMLTFL